jgi:hypothetical protein
MTRSVYAGKHMRNIEPYQASEVVTSHCWAVVVSRTCQGSFGMLSECRCMAADQSVPAGKWQSGSCLMRELHRSWYLLALLPISGPEGPNCMSDSHLYSQYERGSWSGSLQPSLDKWFIEWLEWKHWGLYSMCFSLVSRNSHPPPDWDELDPFLITLKQGSPTCGPRADFCPRVVSFDPQHFVERKYVLKKLLLHFFIVGHKTL